MRRHKKKQKIITLLLVNSLTARKRNIKGWSRLIFIFFDILLKGFLLHQSFGSFSRSFCGSFSLTFERNRRKLMNKIYKTYLTSRFESLCIVVSGDFRCKTFRCYARPSLLWPRTHHLHIFHSRIRNKDARERRNGDL